MLAKRLLLFAAPFWACGVVLAQVTLLAGKCAGFIGDLASQ